MTALFPQRGMSACGLADISTRSTNVRLGGKADIAI